MSVRTRIAPSPTGYMHIGTLRTALFDYFLAKQHNGQFIIRIEDTDQTRLVPGAVENLLETFAKLGIHHDEGPVLLPDGTMAEKGAYGPYVQSKRLDTYRPYVDELIRKDHAYYCFCTKERLDEMRKEQQALKQTPRYDRRCLSLDSAEVKTRIDRGEPYVVRMRIPEGKAEFLDPIRGKISFDYREVDDQVILKSDGFPTYHLAVVVDDHLMKITHVLRGEEWLSSTPKQIALHQMLGWEMPVYAHVPLLLNPDRSKLSKRQGDVAVEDYLKRGYVPAALINFVSTLGFNPKSDQEIYSVEELTAYMDLSRVNSSGAVLNMEKLDWMNNVYLRTLSPEELAEAARPFVQADVEHAVVRRALWVERERVDRLDQLNDRIQTYFQPHAYDPSLLVWKKADAKDAREQLARVALVLGKYSEDTFADAKKLEASLLAFIKEHALQNGNVLWPLRVALSGLEKSATPFECLWVLGKDASIARIEKAIEMVS